MSVRSDILASIETALKNIPGIGDVSVGRYEQVDLENLGLPALFVLQGDDQLSEEGEEFGQETFRWDVNVEAWCVDSSAEALFAEIHSTMAGESILGGSVLRCHRAGSKMLSLDPGRGIVAMQQIYEITYQHAEGQP